MKKSKILLIAASAILFSSASFATHHKHAAPKSKPGLKDGFYLGVRAGYDNYTARDNLSYTDLEGEVFSINPVLSPIGWAGGVFLGYGKYLGNRLYLGGEANFNATGAQSSYALTALTMSGSGGLDTNSLKTTVSANNNYGLAILPGIKVNNNSLVYARIGYTWSLIKTQEIFTTIGPSTITFNKSKVVGGLTYGLGLEMFLVGNLSLRADYTYTSFNHVTSPIGSRFSPTDNQFMLGVACHLA